MYEEYICNAARTMAETMKNADIPMYGSRLRLPDRKAIITLLKEMRQLMFPAYFGDPALMTLAAADYAALLLERIETSLSQQIALALPLEDEGRAPQIAREVVEQLPRIQQLLLTDIDAIFDGDPAAQNREEIVLAYPGLFAIFAYRVSHELYLRHVPTIPRMMTEYAHSRTGIDIHPGAQIGSYFFIDHGTGIVVGETTIMTTTGAFNVWGQPVMLTNGGPNYQTQVLLMDIRNLAFPAGPAAAGMASAMALLLGIILMAIAAIQLIFMNKED